MSKNITIVVGHGSRVAKSNDDFEALVQRFSQKFPNNEFKVGYVELAPPKFKEVLFESVKYADEVTVLPLFLLTAGHIKHDIMDYVKEAREQYPKVNINLASALGVHSNMAELVKARIDAAFTLLNKDPQKTAILMIGRGSSDTDANSDFCKLVRLVEEGMPYERMAYSFMAVVRPKVQEVLIRLIKEEHETIVLSPYLLFDGQLLERMQALVDKYSKENPNIDLTITKTFGADNLVLDLFEKRLKEAETQSVLT